MASSSYRSEPEGPHVSGVRDLPERLDRPRWSRAEVVLAVLSASFGVLASQYVPRLSNNLWSDEEFSGWTAAIAHRMAAGEHIYRDFTLPIPPGSMAILAAMERWLGRPAFLHEVALCAACHLALGLLAYAIVVPLTTRINALLVSASTLAIVVQLPKELAYDHTAQVVGWTACAVLVRAFLASGRSASLLAGGAGLVTGFVFFFKQSTGTGTTAGAIVAFAWLSAVAHRRGGWAKARSRVGNLGCYLAGNALGFGAALLGVRALGGSVAGYLETVFVDGPKLKGGGLTLLGHAALYVLHDPTIQVSLTAVAAAIVVAMRMAARSGAFVFPSALGGISDASPIPWPTVAKVSAFFAATFGVGASFLAFRLKSVPWPAALVHGASTGLTGVGLAFAAAFFIANVRSPERPSPRRDAFNALLLATLAAACVHNLSFPGVRFFYDNNALIAVALLALLVAAERSDWPWLRWGLAGVLIVSILGGKMERYLDAHIPVRDKGYWGGMWVNERGAAVLKAAARARELAEAPDDEVLVLPEDPALAMLIARPRPPLCGAIVFVDQYPARCVAQDLKHLENHLPKVIIVHPHWENEWLWVYRLWSPLSPAEFINVVFLHNLLPEKYRLDSSYATEWFGAPDTMDVYVLRPTKHASDGDGEKSSRTPAPADAR